MHTDITRKTIQHRTLTPQLLREHRKKFKYNATCEKVHIYIVFPRLLMVFNISTTIRYKDIII